MAIAIGASAGAAGAIAAANAARHRKEKCKITLDEFNATNSTVEQKQAYASCVETIYPDSPTGGDVMVGAVMIVILIVIIAAAIRA
jgi:hypothetical protein